MIRILLGGSPCTKFSIAQKNDRETQPNSGIGWELFKNYLIAKEKFKPDYFLYENNVSAAQPIKDEIKRQLGVWDGTFLTPYSDVRYIEINSALVSAQNRERFYVHNCGEVGQPKDRGILLKDVLESGITWKDKQNTIDANYFKGGNFTNMQKQSGQRLAVAEPIPIQTAVNGKARTIKAQYQNSAIANFITNGKHQSTGIAEPVRVGAMPRPNGELSTSQALRVYSIDGKATTINHGGGGVGGKTGLYAVPLNAVENGDKARTLTANYWKCSERDAVVDYAGGRTMVVTNYNYATEFDDNGKPTKAYCYADEKIHTVYEVKDGKITIKGKEYPIKLPDGFYIIRKLTVTECCRLQGMPEWWFKDKDGNKLVSDTQAYKGLGNGWQLDTVKYILQHALCNIPKDEPILLLSLYDGIGTGRRILEELGFINVKYYAYEIDKYCIQLTSYRYSDVIHKGDAFKVRNEGEIETIIW